MARAYKLLNPGSGFSYNGTFLPVGVDGLIRPTDPAMELAIVQSGAIPIGVVSSADASGNPSPQTATNTGGAVATLNSANTAVVNPKTGQGMQVLGQDDMKFIGIHVMTPAGGDSSVSGDRGTHRRQHIATRKVNRMAQVLLSGPKVASAQVGEPYMGADRLCRASIEPSLGATPIRLTAGGRPNINVKADGPIVVTDAAVCPIPKGQAFRERGFTFMPKPPALTNANLAAATTGGTLATGTLYVKPVGVAVEGESILGTEISIAVTGPTGSVTVSATGLDLELTAVDMYVSGAPGTEVLLARFPVVAGVLNATITALPPSYRTETGNAATASRHPFVSATNWQAGDGHNLVPYGGTGADETGNSGGTFIVNGNSSTPGPANIVIGDGFAGSGDRAILLLGHSIPAGLGTATAASTAGGLYTLGAGSYVARALYSRATPISACLYPIATSQLQYLVNGGAAVTNELSLVPYSSEVHLDKIINDLTIGGRTWTQAATDVLAVASMLPPGILLDVYTALPNPSSTDYGMTLGNQAVNPNSEPNRILFNRWRRAGCPIDANGNPVQSGNLFHPNINRSRIYDISAFVEVDSTGAPNPEGGLWPAAVRNSGPFTVSSSAGFAGGPTTNSGTITLAAAAWGSPSTTSPGVVTKVVKVLTGAQAGCLAVVANNSGNVLTLYSSNLSGTYSGGAFSTSSYTGINPTIGAPITAPLAAGDTFELWDSWAPDCTHPSIYGHGNLAPYWNSVA